MAGAMVMAARAAGAMVAAARAAGAMMVAASEVPAEPTAGLAAVAGLDRAVGARETQGVAAEAVV